MPTTVHAYAAPEAGAPFETFEYDLPDLGPHDVDIAVEHCGICHSDLSMQQNEWGLTAYPFVPGHEVAGRIKSVGEHVKHLKAGDRVGLGWHSAYCMTCDSCMGGHHNMCSDYEQTIVGRHGGFADLVRAKAEAVFKVPDELDLKETGPLLCGGITVFNPMVQFGVRPTDSVAVVGIGGLGHLALKFANAWGCHVTAFTSESKMQEAKDLGAHETIDSRDPNGVKSCEGRFDYIVSTVNVKLDWNAYIKALSARGRMHYVGAVMEPLDLEVFPLIFGQKQVSGSPVGSPSTINTMLRFAARHGIGATTEHFKMSDVNDAMEHLESGKARYRVVLDV
ncbi:ahr [Symbiodinium necroappetens]|uniref:alcohol dehydrogenase (NADP(+)) n=1 Tax=Symbiodinium necroappetens TaxID=1628268 RepID=A0A812ZWE8_9DINO|nr:ahr [Symbiodinium necroappetens]